jgi:hypothetical protein
MQRITPPPNRVFIERMGCIRLLFVCGLAVFMMACGSDSADSVDEASTQEASTAATESTTDGQASESGTEEMLTPQAVRDKHGAMFDAVKNFLNDPALLVDGQWTLHFGDAALFGPSFDLAQWKRTGDEAHYERAILALEANRALVEAAAEAPFDYMDQLEAVAMALLSLIECGLYLDDADVYQQAADLLLEPFDEIAISLDDYMDLDAGEFAATTYGPTSLSSFLALMHFEHVMAYPDANAEHHLNRGKEILAHVHERAWDDTLAAFRFAPDDERLMLYPNITMMLAYARAESLVDDPLNRQRFEETYAGIQPLKDEDGDHYHSPYSAEEMGATDDDYSTLSSQNYLMLGLIAAYQNTGEQWYLEEIDAILGFIEDKLLDEGKILHHWVNGRPANDEDPWLYCLGCNFQTLYILVLIETAMVDISGSMETE